MNEMPYAFETYDIRKQSVQCDDNCSKFLTFSFHVFDSRASEALAGAPPAAGVDIVASLFRRNAVQKKSIFSVTCVDLT